MSSKKNKREALKETGRSDLRNSVFGSAPEGRSFVLKDGRSLSNLKELADAMREISPDVLSHHVNEERNDFKSWVESSLGDSTLAENLAESSSSQEIELAVLRRIAGKLEE